MKKLVKAALITMLATATLFVACHTEPEDPNLNNGGNNSETPDDPSNPDSPNKNENTTYSIGFDFANAKALGMLDKSSRSARAAEEKDDINGNLVKILEDGSVKNVITVPEGVTLPDVTAIWQSPAGYDDIYLLFKEKPSAGYYTYEDVTYEYDHDGDGRVDETWTTQEPIYHGWSIGQFLCIHSDGTYEDILKSDDNTYRSIYTWDYQNMIQFDKYGYMYYMAYESTDSSSTQIIYRYSPSLKKSVAMTYQAPGLSYSSFQITGDASYIFVQGSSSAGSFLRAVPVSNPNNPINLTYGFTPEDYFYDNQTETLYFSIMMWGDNSSLSPGLYRLKKNANNSYSIDDAERVTKPSFNSNLVHEESSAYSLIKNCKFNHYRYFFDSDSDGGRWNTEYIEYVLTDEDGNPNESEFLKYIIEDVLNDKYYSSATYSESSFELDSWHPLTVDDVDIRFDSYKNTEYAALATATEGLKNEEALKVIFSDVKLTSLLCCAQYQSVPTNSYPFLSNICYQKDKNKLLYDSEPEYFEDKDGVKQSIYFRDLFVQGYTDSYGNAIGWFYSWNEEYLDSDGNPDAKKLLDSWFACCNVHGEKYFTLSNFKDVEGFEALASDKKDEEAIEWLTEDNTRMYLLFKYFYVDYINGYFDDKTNGWVYPHYWYDEPMLMNNLFLYNTCFLTNGEHAYKLRKNYNNSSSEWNLQDFFRTEQGLFAFTGSSWSSSRTLFQILNQYDEVVMEVPDVLASHTPVGMSPAGNGFVFEEYLTTASGSKTGYQTLYYYDMPKDTVDNLFKQLPAKDSFEIFSFSAAGDTVYYSGIQGGGYVTCRVSISTLQNEILDIAYKLSQIVVLN